MKPLISIALTVLIALTAAAALAERAAPADEGIRPTYEIEIILRITEVQPGAGAVAQVRWVEPAGDARPLRASQSEPNGIEPRPHLDPINQTMVDVIKASHRIGMALLRIWMDHWTDAASGGTRAADVRAGQAKPMAGAADSHHR